MATYVTGAAAASATSARTKSALLIVAMPPADPPVSRKRVAGSRSSSAITARTISLPRKCHSLVPRPSAAPAVRLPACASDEQYARNTLENLATGFTVALWAMIPVFFSPLNLRGGAIAVDSADFFTRARWATSRRRAAIRGPKNGATRRRAYRALP